MSKNNLEVITCKAAVCWGVGEPQRVEEIQVEPPKISEIRVKMLCASLCHSDIFFWHGFPFALFPRVLGHEGVGVVESVGEGVTNLKEGDIVIPTFIGECKECDNCISGKTNLCRKYPFPIDGLMPDGSSRMSIKGQRLYHFFTCSTWSEYTVLNVNYVIKIDSRVPLPHATLISCGFSTGFGAAWKEPNLDTYSTLAVFGLGGVGLGVIEGARIRGARKIIGVDLNEKKREKGEILGMTDFINPSKSDKSVSELIKEMTNGLGVDYCFECTGVVPLINQALEASILGRGVTIVVGGHETSVPINLLHLIMYGRTLKGSIFGGIKPQSDLPFIIDKCLNKELNLDALVTHEVAFNDINQAFELLKQPECVKIVIHMNNK